MATRWIETILALFGASRAKGTPADAEHARLMAERRRAHDEADGFPWLMYVAVIDPSTRPGHAALNGKIWHKDDPIWKSIYPPNGLGCRCRTRALTDGQMKRQGLRPSPPARAVRRILPDGTTATGVQLQAPAEGAAVTVWL